LGVGRGGLRGARPAAGQRDHHADGDQHDGAGQHPALPSHFWPPAASFRIPPHACVAALRIVMPPGLLEDGIFVVSIRGSPLTGSGKSLTPCWRTQAANRSASDCCFGLRFPLKAPGGSRALHASTAFFHTAGVTSIPKMYSPFAFGSGKWGTPCVRM